MDQGGPEPGEGHSGLELRWLGADQYRVRPTACDLFSGYQHNFHVVLVTCELSLDARAARRLTGTDPGIPNGVHLREFFHVGDPEGC